LSHRDQRTFRHGGGRDERDFVCRHCRRPVSAESFGTRHRNHCPHCLWSLHLDNSPGDRASACTGEMEPIGIWVRTDGEWAVIHRCRTCGTLRTNRVAGDDSAWAMMSLAARPLAQPPFPLDL
jgi:RNHCP domain